MSCHLQKDPVDPENVLGEVSDLVKAKQPVEVQRVITAALAVEEGPVLRVGKCLPFVVFPSVVLRR